MSEKIESIIYCEGFYDRAFWDGILQYLKCATSQLREVL